MPKKEAMRLQSVYYGDCVKHLEQWNAQNQEAPQIRPQFGRFDLSRPAVEQQRHLQHPLGQRRRRRLRIRCPTQATAFTDIWHWNGEADVRVKKICGIIDDQDYYDHPARKSMRA